MAAAPHNAAHMAPVFEFSVVQSRFKRGPLMTKLGPHLVDACRRKRPLQWVWAPSLRPSKGLFPARPYAHLAQPYSTIILTI